MINRRGNRGAKFCSRLRQVFLCRVSTTSVFIVMMNRAFEVVRGETPRYWYLPGPPSARIAAAGKIGTKRGGISVRAEKWQWLLR